MNLFVRILGTALVILVVVTGIIFPKEPDWMDMGQRAVVNCAFVAGAIAFLWSEYLLTYILRLKRLETNNLVDELLPPAYIGFGVFVVVVAYFCIELDHINEIYDLVVFVEKNVASGRMSFVFSMFLFGCYLIWKGGTEYFKPKNNHADYQRWAMLSQYVVFTVAMVALYVGFSRAEPTPFVALLSWSIFFILDDWLITEHYVVYKKNSLPASHAFRFISFNALIISGITLIITHLDHDNTELQNVLIVTGHVIAAFFAWTLTVVPIVLLKKQDHGSVTPKDPEVFGTKDGLMVAAVIALTIGCVIGCVTVWRRPSEEMAISLKAILTVLIVAGWRPLLRVCHYFIGVADQKGLLDRMSNIASHKIPVTHDRETSSR